MLSDLLKERKKSLKVTDTVVTARDGSRILERDGKVVNNLPPPDVLPPALQPERKRLCIVPPEPPTWSLPELEEFTLPPLEVGTRLRVLTWNVWFAPTDADRRMAALVREALAQVPDVLCLQEVVPELADSLRTSRAASALRKVYAVSQNDVGPYGCLLLARHSLGATFKEVRVPRAHTACIE